VPEHSHQGHRGSAPSAQEMEERYRATAQVWSGSPNATLVDHVSDLPAGTALDIGCGEGADVQWLHERGWRVLGIDFAPTAVARTRARGVPAEVATFDEFSHAPFDLVTVHYGSVRATAGEVALLEKLVAPGWNLALCSPRHGIRRNRHAGMAGGKSFRVDGADPAAIAAPSY